MTIWVWMTWQYLAGFNDWDYFNDFDDLGLTLLGLITWEYFTNFDDLGFTLRVLMTCPDFSSTPVALPLSISTWST